MMAKKLAQKEDEMEDPYEKMMREAESKVPKRLKHLPVYSYDDDHEENEWISVDLDNKLWHVVGHEYEEICDQAEMEQTSYFNMSYDEISEEIFKNLLQENYQTAAEILTDCIKYERFKTSDVVKFLNEFSMQ